MIMELERTEGKQIKTDKVLTEPWDQICTADYIEVISFP